MKKYNNRSVLLFLQLLIFAACSKTEEPPRPVGNKLPYAGAGISLAKLVDSIPEASIYRAALKRTRIQPYMDSLSAGNPGAPFTLFVPANKAWESAGYTMDNINTVPAAELDTIIRYLTITGGVPANTKNLMGETTYYPLMYKDRNITRSQVPTPFWAWTNRYYYYRLIVGLTDGVLRLNGRTVSKTAGIQATNGAVFMIDTLITKPFYETYQVLSSDTSFSFYMAALKKNNAVYARKGLLNSFNDTAALVLTVGSDSPGLDPFAIVFAPDNNAFRKAGFYSVADINSYIDQSVVAGAGNVGPMMTNMDSILMHHRLLSAFSGINPGYSFLYTIDLRYGLYTVNLGNAPSYGALMVQNNSGQTVLHRRDVPSGRGAMIISASDNTTLTGVIHRVDNLLLPTP
ncbi:fasciclin domain-containing protein [Chitinophaga flava]|nr:fasciclin domain-containing protein [Chitinophaga flava]